MKNMQLEQNKSIIRLVFESAMNQGNLAIIDEIFDPRFVDHSTADQVAGPDGVRDYFTQVRAGFPDIHVTIDDLISDESSVAVRTTWQGTHLGTYEGIAPTNRQVTRTMIQIFRIADDKILEEWNEGNGLLE